MKMTQTALTTAVMSMAILITACDERNSPQRSLQAKPAAESEIQKEASMLTLDGTKTEQKIARSQEQWREQLTPEQFRVTRLAGTERAFTGAYANSKTPGIYTCVCCELPLFSSETKFDSGTGWPSYYQPIAPHNVAENEDTSHGMRRVEVVCARCDAHLGHVFPDGPAPTGLRYCINSASLKLVPGNTTLPNS